MSLQDQTTIFMARTVCLSTSILKLWWFLVKIIGYTPVLKQFTSWWWR